MKYAEIIEILAPELDALNRLITSALHTSTPLMNEITATYLRTKGKQIRPVMVLLCARLLGSVNEKVLHAAAALEMLHNASLIHDDVIDETKRRRGVDTVNALWDNHIAVLTGDFFVSAALEQAAATDSLPIVKSMGDLGKELSLGEIHQICNARDRHFRIADYFDAIDKKTASLFVKCAFMGAEATGTPAEVAAPLLQFARLLGLCFQIKDDIFDYFPSEKIGKPTGNDLREGKVTLPLLHALAESDNAPAMKTLLAKDELDDTDIRTLIDFAIACGGIDYAYMRMEQMHREATELLTRAYPDSEARQALLDLFSFIISRDI
ncbi:MAG: polyprenyl synthetase family protein [Bacteroidales bacterium]|nr:polyprenyl synthetase family protein [Bacteroidales bacterium]